MDISDSEVPLAIASSNLSSNERPPADWFSVGRDSSAPAPPLLFFSCYGGSASAHEDAPVPTLEELRRQWPTVVDLAVHAHPGEIAR